MYGTFSLSRLTHQFYSHTLHTLSKKQHTHLREYEYINRQNISIKINYILRLIEILHEKI